MRFILRDDFGLGEDDVQGHGNDIIPPGAGADFKAWYILEHYRCKKAFETRLVIGKNF